MHHVLTVHFRSPEWIDPQLSRIERYMPADTRVWAVLNGILDQRHWDRFHFARDLMGTHAEKLNQLAKIVGEQADPDDVLVFLDGDAFPVAPISAEEVLGGYALAAVRREENMGDRQPHPCFCMTTVRTWKELDGDWREGYQWRNSAGLRVTDVGANLLRSLEEHHVDWRPIVRSNGASGDPISFAVYGGIVYHHGSGFRTGGTRGWLTLRRPRVPEWVPGLYQLDRRLAFRSALRHNSGGFDREEVGARSRAMYAAILEGDDFLSSIP